MKQYFTKRNIYIILFALLYFNTALVSTIHAVSFFCLANMLALGVLLAVTFEIGQAATLFSILTSKKERSKTMPWILMFILTSVQVLGNVFSSYKYLITNSADQLRFFKEPIFVWMDLPDQQANVILTYIIGAILPICSLALTSMLTNYLEDESNNIGSLKVSDSESISELINDPINDTNNDPNEYQNKDAETSPPEDLNDENNGDLNNHTVEDIQENLDGLESDPEDVSEQPVKDQHEEVKFPFEELENERKKESKFINL